MGGLPRGVRCWGRCGLAVGIAVVHVLVYGVAATAVEDSPATDGDLANDVVVLEPSEVALIDSGEPEPAQDVESPSGMFGDEAPSEPTRVEELVELRDASTEAWLNDDGSVSMTSYLAPQFFQRDGSTEWERIDTTLVADVGSESRRVRSRANSWETSFGATSSPEGMQRISLGEHMVTFSPVDAVAVTPVADGSMVTYEGLWPETDAVYTVSSIGVDEKLILYSAAAPSTFG